MKNTLLLVAFIGLLTSCGSNKGFHKKHHRNRDWVKVDYVENSKEVVAHEEVSEDRPKTQLAVKPEIKSIDKEVVSEDVTNLVSEQTNVSAESKIKETPKENRRAERLAEKVQRRIAPGSISNVVDQSEVVTSSPKEIHKSDKKNEGSVGELLLLALLIALIIVVFSFIDGVLGGLLGLILVIFLILLLLRYFGVV